MAPKTISEIQKEVSSVLIQYEWMFEDADKPILRIQVKPEISNIYRTTRKGIFNWPKVVSRGVIDGLHLKNGKGCIAIRQTYLYLNTRDLDLVGYVYKYMTDEMIYQSLHRQTKEERNLDYIFHYDMDLLHAASTNPRVPVEDHGREHLQVMHDLPRFKTTDVSLGLFLSHVAQLCFKKNPANEYEARKEPFFSFQ
jgi:hypothetical protein